MYVIGKTGMGKSTMLENMAIQDIHNGNGIAFVDPHGATAETLLDYIPKERLKDVLYFAPFDVENPISFNIMEDVGYDKRHLVADGLMSAFKKIWVDAWSARMEYILNNTILALLEYPDATLLGINRMYTDKEYRKKVVENISDPSVKSFWMDEWAKYTDRYTQDATPAIQNKVGQFTANPIIRNIIGQPKSSFDLRKLMDEKKILIINLSKGRMGEGNANLLGSMIITKLYLAAMSRADLLESEMKRLPSFYLYVDEFQSFANESFAGILSEARKYKLALTVAHQYIEQMTDEVRAAVFGNVGTMIAFRVGAFDAEVLEKEFAPMFIAEDIVNLGFTQIYLKLMIDGIASHPFSAVTLPPIEPPKQSMRDEVIKSSREQFAQTRAEVESAINEWYKPIEPEKKERKDLPARAPQAREISADRRRNERREYPRPNQERRRTPKPPYQEKRAIHTPPRSDIPAEEETAVSLEALKRKQKAAIRINNKKEPTKKHVEDLRSALAGVLDAQKQEEKAPILFPTKSEEQNRESTISKSNQSRSEGRGPSTGSENDLKEIGKETPKTREHAKSNSVTPEIPEEELRNMLKVDE